MEGAMTQLERAILASVEDHAIREEAGIVVLKVAIDALMYEQRALESRCADLEVKCASLTAENAMLRSQLRGKRR